MFDGEFREFNEDTSFLDNISLWGVFKAVLTIILIYSAVFYVWQLNHAKQEEQRIEEVGMAITALASEGYTIYIDGQRELFVPDIASYDVEFNRSTRQINLTSRSFSTKDALLETLGLNNFQAPWAAKVNS